MKFLQSLPRSLAASCLAVVITLNSPLAQTAQQSEPQPGQQGKDVIWLPTPQALVDKMLDLANVTEKDFVIDLGSGDGRTVITAAKRGARALGIEYNPNLVEVSQRNAAAAGVSDKASFKQADIFATDFSEATVITMFLLPTLNIKLRPKILEMKPGTRVVSNSFDMGDWTPDRTERVSDNCTSYCTAHFWIVPAKVEGTWKTEQGELALEQKYQVVTGTLKSGNVVAPITDGKLTGDQITFSAAGVQYSGQVNGDTIEGVRKSGSGESRWRATRSAG